MISELVARLSFISVVSLSLRDSNASKLFWVAHSEHSALVSHPVCNFIDFIYLLSLEYRRFSAIHSFLVLSGGIFFHTLPGGRYLVNQ